MKPNADSACERCGGTGFVWLPPHDRYPNGAYAICPCRLQAQRRRRMDALMAHTGLTAETMARWSFDTFDPDAAVADAQGRARLARIKAHCQAYAQDPNGWLVLCGPYGCGKSHLAYATAAACHATGRAVYVSTVPDLLETLRQGFSSSPSPRTRGEGRGEGRATRNAQPTTHNGALSFSARLALVCDADLLVLDDLGAQHDTPWSAEKLYQIIDHRYRLRLPLLVTTNVNLYDPQGRIDPRILSRILDGANLPAPSSLAPVPRGEGRGEGSGAARRDGSGPLAPVPRGEGRGEGSAGGSPALSRVLLLNAGDYRQRSPRQAPLPAPTTPATR